MKRYFKNNSYNIFYTKHIYREMAGTDTGHNCRKLFQFISLKINSYFGQKAEALYKNEKKNLNCKKLQKTKL